MHILSLIKGFLLLFLHVVYCIILCGEDQAVEHGGDIHTQSAW